MLAIVTPPVQVFVHVAVQERVSVAAFVQGHAHAHEHTHLGPGGLSP